MPIASPVVNVELQHEPAAEHAGARAAQRAVARGRRDELLPAREARAGGLGGAFGGRGIAVDEDRVLRQTAAQDTRARPAAGREELHPARVRGHERPFGGRHGHVQLAHVERGVDAQRPRESQRHLHVPDEVLDLAARRGQRHGRAGDVHGVRARDARPERAPRGDRRDRVVVVGVARDRRQGVLAAAAHASPFTCRSNQLSISHTTCSTDSRARYACPSCGSATKRTRPPVPLSAWNRRSDWIGSVPGF